jgi:carbon storage regulator
MLLITRKASQAIKILDDITITVVKFKDDSVTIGIDAPAEVSIYRQELYDKIQEERITYNIEIDLSITSHTEIRKEDLYALQIPVWFVEEMLEGDFNQFILNWKKLNIRKPRSRFYPLLKDYKVQLMQLYATVLHIQNKKILEIQRILSLAFGSQVIVKMKN